MEVRTGRVRGMNYLCLVDLTLGEPGSRYGERLKEGFLRDRGIAR